MSAASIMTGLTSFNSPTRLKNNRKLGFRALENNDCMEVESVQTDSVI